MHYMAYQNLVIDTHNCLLTYRHSAHINHVFSYKRGLNYSIIMCNGSCCFNVGYANLTDINPFPAVGVVLCIMLNAIDRYISFRLLNPLAPQTDL